MRQELKDLHDGLEKASLGAYPEIPDFTLKAPCFEFVSLDILDNQASKFDRILRDFLDKDGDLMVKELEATSDELTSYQRYVAFEKMLKNLAATVSEIEADMLELTMTDVGDFQRLNYLKEVFVCYNPYLRADCADCKKEFIDTVRRSFGGRIRQIRQQQGLTIEKFADCVYLSRVEMNRYELGRRVPPLAMLFQIAHTFHVSVDWLLGVEKNESD